MSIHQAIEQSGKQVAKCGARPWGWNPGLYLTQDASQIDCKRCLGTGRKPPKSEAIAKDYVGQVFSCSWGYSMTIVEFAVCVRQTGKRLVLRECGRINRDDGIYGGTSIPTGEPLPGAPEFLVREISGGYFRGSLISARMNGDKHYKNDSATFWKLTGFQPQHYNHND
ncbi:hypothetical protein F9K50_06110 [bacterium]|nr:MAG: hypothetical protein F9K50_06110 [bacterium]